MIPPTDKATRSTHRTREKPGRILLVDDHPIVRFGLSELIDAEPDLEIVAQAATAGEALKLIAEHRPDLAVIDLSLGNDGGLELIKQVHSQHEQVRVLVASMHDESLFAERALRAGAMGYINKSEVTQELVSAVRRVLKGNIYLSDQMTERMLDRLTHGDEVAEQSLTDTLSDRELEIFQLFGQGRTAREIADNLHLSIKTVDTYRGHIREKLKLQNNAQLMMHPVKWVLDSQ